MNKLACLLVSFCNATFTLSYYFLHVFVDSQCSAVFICEHCKRIPILYNTQRQNYHPPFGNLHSLHNLEPLNKRFKTFFYIVRHVTHVYGFWSLSGHNLISYFPTADADQLAASGASLIRPGLIHSPLAGIHKVCTHRRGEGHGKNTK